MPRIEGPLPPTIKLLLSEARVESPAALEKKLRDNVFLRDLRDQAQYTDENWSYADFADPLPGGFVVAPSGSADPLFGTDKCPVLSCRIEGAHAFAHSIALYADLAIVPDVFTIRFLQEDFDTSQEASGLFNDLAVLTEIMPLIRMGIVRFGSPPHFCERCDAALATASQAAVDAIADRAAGEIAGIAVRTEKSRNLAAVTFKPGFVPLGGVEIEVDKKTARKLTNFSGRRLARGDRGKANTLLRELLGETLQELTRPLAMAVRNAQRSGAVVATGYRAEVLFLHQIETGTPYDLRRWERIRTVQLPFVRELDIKQVTRLREDAQHALPALRHLLAESFKEPVLESDAKVVEVVSHLREEALEVQAELGAWQRATGYQFHTAFGALGLSYVLYGLAAAGQLVGTALSSFISTLRGIHSERFKQKLEQERLKARPGYVLVRARELLAHERGAEGRNDSV